MADANTDIALPLSIPAGSVILSTAPLKWREPDGTECTLRTVRWEPDGWHVLIDAVKIAPNATLTIGPVEERAGEE